MATERLAIPAAPETRSPSNPISRARIETVLARAVGAFGLVFSLQSLPALITQTSGVMLVWNVVIAASFFGGLLVVIAAALARRFVAAANGYVAFAYLAGLITWPFAADASVLTDDAAPWLWFVLTVATACAAIAFSVWLAAAYTVIVPVVYGVVRLTPAGGSAEPIAALLNVVYAIILGGALLVLVTVLRQAASSVDAAQSTALERYAHAVRQHATEVERVQVDAIVHDSVLTTFLSAARAYTPDARELAATMAGNAIDHLADAGLGTTQDGSTVALRKLTQRIIDAASTMSAPIAVRTDEIGACVVPVNAAEALYSAAVQAMVNSLQHAGSDGRDVERVLSLRGIGASGVSIEVRDNGIGFDVHQVPSERLGLRVSIRERVSNVGGVVAVDSAKGEGTTVRITWPNPEQVREDQNEISGAAS
ncbi:sensor histidine kinase [Planctomonas psychrotolerans]|uniref:sensor histidine kinase n=1 Tax=Planctomonas psychrotolerans TaxID=2528712 RepID=UPI00123A0EC3|nr:ATP-binding protein [Planctomonas psychrotolerans]